MSTVRQGLVVAIALSTVAFTSTAMAGKGGVKGATPTAPGQAGERTKRHPGQAGRLGLKAIQQIAPGTTISIRIEMC